MLVGYYQHRPDRGAIPSCRRSLVHAPCIGWTTNLRSLLPLCNARRKAPCPGFCRCFSSCTCLLSGRVSTGESMLTCHGKCSRSANQRWKIRPLLSMDQSGLLGTAWVNTTRGVCRVDTYGLQWQSRAINSGRGDVLLRTSPQPLFQVAANLELLRRSAAVMMVVAAAGAAVRTRRASIRRRSGRMISAV